MMKTTMMNKIRSIKQLKTRQRKLEQRRAELEKAIHYDWLDVKKSLNPKNLAGEVFEQVFNKDSETGNSPWANSLSQLAAGLTRIAVEKVEEKIAEWRAKK